jgi:small conductance mechanosensitive channel
VADGEPEPASARVVAGASPEMPNDGITVPWAGVSMDSIVAPAAQLTGLAPLVWTWITAFAPRLLAALVIVACGLLLSRWLRRGIVSVSEHSQRIDPTLRPVLIAAVQYAIFILMIILVLNQLGIETTSLLAVLGAAGLAVGLALQGTLSNIAAGIMLLWLRPFRLGDYIEVNGQAGVVEETGLFVCILRSYDGVRIFAPNSTIWNFSLRNHTRVERRMLAVSVTVARKAADTAAGALAGALAATPGILPTPTPDVFLEQLGDANAMLTCRFWTSHESYGALQRSIVEAVRGKLQGAGIAAEDIQLIARAAPSPTDPTRLIDL